MAQGFDLELFWSLTAREVALHFEAAEKRRVREHNDRAWLAWNIAALPKQKRFPALRSLLLDEPRRAQAARQSPADMLAIVKMMNAALGGAVV